MFCLCGSFGGNILLILTTLSYNTNSATQGGYQLLLKLYITDLYEFCIFVGSFSYKVLILCLCELFGGNSLLLIDINYFSI